MERSAKRKREGERHKEEGREVEWSGKVTFGDQGLFVVTFSHLCSSLMPGQCALAHLSPASLTSLLPLLLLLLLLLLPLMCVSVCVSASHTQNAESFHMRENT